MPNEFKATYAEYKKKLTILRVLNSLDTKGPSNIDAFTGIILVAQCYKHFHFYITNSS